MNDEALQRYLAALRQWWPILLGVVVVGITLAWVTAPGEDELAAADEAAESAAGYRATHLLVRGQLVPSTEQLELVAQLANTGEIPQQVVERYQGQVDPSAILSTRVEADDDLGTLAVTTTQRTPELATEIATAYATSITRYFDSRAEAERQSRIDRATARLSALDEQLQALDAEAQQHAEGTVERRLADSELNVVIDQYATLKTELSQLNAEWIDSTFVTLQQPTAVALGSDGLPAAFAIPDSRGARVLLALLVTVFLGVALVMGVDRLDTKIRTREDAEAAFGLPVVTEIPQVERRMLSRSSPATHWDPASSLAESYRSLRVAVHFTARWRLQRDAPTGQSVSRAASQSPRRGAPRTVLVTSPGQAEGKSNVVANLATSMAESGENVLIIDCDFRRSSVHELFGVIDNRGLHQLVDRSTEALERVAQATPVPRVSLVRAGAGDHAPAWFLADSEAMVASARELADVVIFDTGPLLGTNEAAALIPSVDAVLVVARSGTTSAATAKQATEQLTRLQAMVAGIVLVGSTGSRVHSTYEPMPQPSPTEPRIMKSR